MFAQYVHRVKMNVTRSRWSKTDVLGLWNACSQISARQMTPQASLLSILFRGAGHAATWSIKIHVQYNVVTEKSLRRVGRFMNVCAVWVRRRDKHASIKLLFRQCIVAAGRWRLKRWRAWFPWHLGPFLVWEWNSSIRARYPGLIILPLARVARRRNMQNTYLLRSEYKAGNKRNYTT